MTAQAKAKPALTRTPCPTCLPLAQRRDIDMEMVQRVPEGAWAPISKKYKDVRICFDCASAEALVQRAKETGCPTFLMARIAVGNDRQEQYRLPGVPMGLVMAGYVRPSKPGDLEEHYKWLDENRWFGEEDREEA
jgi:hypothetical protein